jgi:hypothetical protein
MPQVLVAGLLSVIGSESSVAHLRQGSSRRMAPRQGDRRSTPILQQPDQPPIPASCWPRRTKSGPCSPKGSVLLGTASGGCLARGAFLFMDKIRVVGSPPAAGLLTVKAPRRGNRRSTPIFNSLISRRFLPRAGPGAPSPSPTAPKLPECGGTASGCCSVRGAFSRTERSASDQAVRDLRRSAFSFDGEPCAERSSAEVGYPTRSGKERGALPRWGT